MPIDPLSGSLIIGGASVISDVANVAFQGKMNHKQRAFAREQANTAYQRNLDNWHMQNSYNHPSAQMARLREAGLNPNMVYGNGATTTASSPSGASPASWNPRSPEIDLGTAARSTLSAYNDVQIKQAQIDNLRRHNDLIAADTALRGVQAASLSAGAAKTIQDTQQSSDMFSYSMDALKAQIENTQASTASTRVNTQFQLDENERRAAQNASGLKEAAERILTMRIGRSKDAASIRQMNEQLSGIRSDNTLKELDINLRHKGINPNDPLYMRMLGQALADPDTKGLGHKLKNLWNNLFGNSWK